MWGIVSRSSSLCGFSKHEDKAVIDRVFDFDDAIAAYDYLESGQHFVIGKIVLRIA